MTSLLNQNAQSAPLSVLRRLHRALSYADLPEVKGEGVLIHGAETAPEDVLDGLSSFFPHAEVWPYPHTSPAAGTVAKYGLLDLTYETTLPMPAHTRGGLRVLRELGLVEPGLSDPDFAVDLADQAEQGRRFVRLFLQTEHDIDPPEMMKRLRHGLPAGYWPRRFEVVDACLTTAPSGSSSTSICESAHGDAAGRVHRPPGLLLASAAERQYRWVREWVIGCPRSSCSFRDPGTKCESS